jgi:poly(3-hydroxybutyrate) depolymerase
MRWRFPFVDEPLAKLVARFLLLLAASWSLPAAADEEPMLDGPKASVHEQVLSIPGDPARPVALEATLLMPDGPGPFPLAVMNHGANGKVRPALTPRYRTTFSAYYFLSRGYAVILPMMRGYAGSGGHISVAGCDFARIGREDASDIQAVIDDVSRLPSIDPSRVVIAGQSFGGWNEIARGRGFSAIRAQQPACPLRPAQGAGRGHRLHAGHGIRRPRLSCLRGSHRRPSRQGFSNFHRGEMRRHSIFKNGRWHRDAIHRWKIDRRCPVTGLQVRHAREAIRNICTE